jgi:hypothetical protein
LPLPNVSVSLRHYNTKKIKGRLIYITLGSSPRLRPVSEPDNKSLRIAH